MQVPLGEVTEHDQLGTRELGDDGTHSGDQLVEPVERHGDVELHGDTLGTDGDGDVVADAVQLVALRPERHHATTIADHRRQLERRVGVSGAVDHHERSGELHRQRRADAQVIARDVHAPRA